MKSRASKYEAATCLKLAEIEPHAHDHHVAAAKRLHFARACVAESQQQGGRVRGRSGDYLSVSLLFALERQRAVAVESDAVWVAQVIGLAGVLHALFLSCSLGSRHLMNDERESSSGLRGRRGKQAKIKLPLPGFG